MNKKIIFISVIVVLFILVIGYFIFNTNSDSESFGDSSSNIEGLDEKGSLVGPGGCVGFECNEYCSTNTGECEVWCGENPKKCDELQRLYGDVLKEGEEPERVPREGDGLWEKTELTFYIKDEEGILTSSKRKVIQGVFNSEEKSDGGFWGWNAALEELNRLYPENEVPDVFIEVNSEEEADFIISVHSEELFCCDYGGDPVKGRERSEIDENFVKIKSRSYLYDVVKIDEDFMGDIARHEIGHGIGIFSHVVDRENDLMSVVSPSSVIKRGNLDDLYVKYRDKIIESQEEAMQKDLDVKDRRVGFR